LHYFRVAFQHSPVSLGISRAPSAHATFTDVLCHIYLHGTLEHEFVLLVAIACVTRREGRTQTGAAGGVCLPCTGRRHSRVDCNLDCDHAHHLDLLKSRDEIAKETVSGTISRRVAGNPLAFLFTFPSYASRILSPRFESHRLMAS